MISLRESARLEQSHQLNDPKGSVGETECNHAVTLQGLDQLHCAVTALSSAETAVVTYMARHFNRVRYWTTGNIELGTINTL